MGRTDRTRDGSKRRGRESDAESGRSSPPLHRERSLPPRRAHGQSLRRRSSDGEGLRGAGHGDRTDPGSRREGQSTDRPDGGTGGAGSGLHRTAGPTGATGDGPVGRATAGTDPGFPAPTIRRRAREIAETARGDGEVGSETASDGGSDGPTPSDLVGDVVSSSGDPLDPGIREEMEAKMGADFGGVRLHTGPTAARAADAIDARAFAVGTHVGFDGGFDPDAPADRHTLAHELAHVQQEGDGADRIARQVREGAELDVSDPADSHEREAERVARAVTASGPARATAGGTAGVDRLTHTPRVHRQPADPHSSPSVGPGRPPAAGGDLAGRIGDLASRVTERARESVDRMIERRRSELQPRTRTPEDERDGLTEWQRSVETDVDRLYEETRKLDPVLNVVESSGGEVLKAGVETAGGALGGKRGKLLAKIPGHVLKVLAENGSEVLGGLGSRREETEETNQREEDEVSGRSNPLD